MRRASALLGVGFVVCSLTLGSNVHSQGLYKSPQAGANCSPYDYLQGGYWCDRPSQRRQAPAKPTPAGQPFDTTLGEMARKQNYCGTNGTQYFFCPKDRPCVPGKLGKCAPAKAAAPKKPTDSPPNSVAKSPAAPVKPDYVAPVPVAANLPYGYLSPRYRTEENRQHLGVDLPAKSGQPVVAPVTGIVVRNQTDEKNEEGSYLVIRELNSLTEHVVGHIASDLKVGATVTKGIDAIGSVITDHVHWGVNTTGILAGMNETWGWGRAPAAATPEEVKRRGWLDPTQLIPRAR